MQIGDSNPTENNGVGAAATNLIDQSDSAKLMGDESISSSQSNAVTGPISTAMKVTATPESADGILQNSGPTNTTANSGATSSLPSDNALTLPVNCSRRCAENIPPTVETAAAAAADTNAMPPPPPTTPGSAISSASAVSSIQTNNALKTSNLKVTDPSPTISLCSKKTATHPTLGANPPGPLTSTSFAAANAATASTTTAPYATIGKPSQPVPAPAAAPNAPTIDSSKHATTSGPKPLPLHAQQIESTVGNPNTAPSTVPSNRLAGAVSVSVTATPARPTNISCRTQQGSIPANPLNPIHSASASKTPAPRPSVLGPYHIVRRPGAPTPGAPMGTSKPLQSYVKASTLISATSQGPPTGAKPLTQMRPYQPTTLSSNPAGNPSIQTVPTPPPSSMHHPHRSATSVPPHVSLTPIPDSASSNNNNGGGGGGPSKKKGNNILRRGKWTNEEEAYANRLISEFKAGLLPLTDGTTLRNFLSKLLNCDPMRISKKFVGNNCIGKQVFRRRAADINRLTPEQIQQTRMELSE
ncbi:hypothetical protein ACHAXS_013939 [Conticribra weissflogii]